MRLPFDLDELDAVAWRALEAGELTPGDIGLMLWIDARRDVPGAARSWRAIWIQPSQRTAASERGSAWSWAGSSPAWRTTSLRDGSRTGARLLAEALDQLLVGNRAPSGLIRHFGDAGWRRRFPNFATQIYSVLALAVVARHALDERALPAAIATADLLLGDAAT